MEEILTGTVASQSWPTQTWILGIPTLEFETGALAIFSFLAFIAAAYYAWEARQARQTMQDQLKAIQQQHLDQFDARVIANKWNDPHQIQLLNLGPSPAMKIRVRAVHNRLGKGMQYLQSQTPGLASGMTFQLGLQDAPAPFPDSEFPYHLVSEREIVILIEAKTVLGKEMDIPVIVLPSLF